MSDSPRYASLQDYVRVIRRRRLLIALVTIAFIGAAIVISLSQTPIYSASASVSFRDPLQDLGTITPTDTELSEIPTVRTAQSAELLTRPEVSRRVQKDLETELSPGQLAASVSAVVDSPTNLVIVTASSADPEFAADLANAYTRAARKVGSRETEKRLDRAARSLNDQIADLRRDSDEPLTDFQVSNVQNQLLRVQTLRQISQPVRITRKAEVPGAPISPQTTRNVVLGGIVGLFLGILGAFARDTFDRRLHGVQDAHAELDMPILGRVAETAFAHPGLAVNGPARMSDLDFEAFRVLRANLGALDSEGQVRSLAVTSGLPEEGKSTVSMSLASAAALAQQRVLLVECDLRRPSLARRLGIASDPGLTDYLVGRAEPQEILQTVPLTQPRPLANGKTPDSNPIGSFVCITAGTPAANAPELLLGERFRTFVDKVTHAYDLVLLDTSPLLVTADALEVVPLADGVLLCVRAQRTTREGARAARTALGHVPERPIGAVVTGLRRGGPDSYDYYYYGG